LLSNKLMFPLVCPTGFKFLGVVTRNFSGVSFGVLFLLKSICFAGLNRILLGSMSPKISALNMGLNRSSSGGVKISTYSVSISSINRLGSESTNFPQRYLDNAYVK